ncbi:MAG: HEPN domain-containing protein [Clostridium paraputrificum]
MNGKYISKINDCNCELDKIKKWISKNKLDSNVKYLVSYSVIRCCGTIESIYKGMVFDYLSSGANKEVLNYLTRNILNSSSNPSCGKIESLLKSVNEDWALEFKGRIKDRNEKIKLNSLVSLRNTFSHGGDITSSIDDVILFFESGEWILEQLYQCIYKST